MLGVVGEQKTKPTQHSVAVLRSLGLNPHLLACRSQDPLSPAVRDKLVMPPSLWQVHHLYSWQSTAAQGQCAKPLERAHCLLVIAALCMCCSHSPP